MDKMRCSIYARYSSDLQHDRSIDDQIRNCRQFADRLGWLVLDSHIYTDRAVSGASTIGRPGINELINDAGQLPVPFDYLLVDDTSRLSRKDGETQTLVDQLRFFGVHVYFVSQNIDTKEKQSGFDVGVRNLLDSQYRRDLASKTLRGMSGQALKGFNPGGRTYGYSYKKVLDASGAIDRKTGQVRVVGTEISIDETAAGIIRDIFRLFAGGATYREIASHLNQQGSEPPGKHLQLERGRSVPTWMPTSVRAILMNPKYSGDWTFNKRGWVTNPATGQRRSVAKDIDEWTVCRRLDLQIVDQSTWERVQERLGETSSRNHSVKRERGTKYPLSGLMKCDICGGNYVLISGSDRPNPLFACCSNYQRGRVGCSNNYRISKTELEKVVVREIETRLLSPNVMSTVVKLVNRKIKRALSELLHDSPAIRKEKQELDKKLKNVLAAIEDGVLSPSLKKRLTEIEQRHRVLEDRLQMLESMASLDDLKVDEDYVTRWIENLKQLLIANPVVAKAELMSLLGQFSLRPVEIDKNRYLQVVGNAQIEGYLLVATGGMYQYMKYRGAGLNRRPPVPQTGALTS